MGRKLESEEERDSEPETEPSEETDPEEVVVGKAGGSCSLSNPNSFLAFRDTDDNELWPAM